MSDRIKGKVKVKNIRYFQNDWGILNVEMVELTDGKAILDERGWLTIKGAMVEPILENTYQIVADFVDDPKWGKQYNLLSMCSSAYVSDKDEASKREYLELLYTPMQVEEMYKTLDDPFTALKEKDYEKLVQIKGVAFKTALKLTKRFDDQYSLSRMMTELSEYELSLSLLKRVLDYYGSPDLAIKKVKDNPYALTVIGGIGFKTADSIALKMGMNEYDVRRIGAFLINYLYNQGQVGYSYVTTDELMDALVEMFGEDIPNLAIAETIHSEDIEKQLWWNDDKTEIGLKYYYNLEDDIANNLIRLINAPSRVRNDKWKSVVKSMEENQGFGFTDQQLEAIEMVMNNNVSIITGGAGCGKSTVAGAIIESLKSYPMAACALSGRAGARLSEVSSQEGMTIHRLLGAKGDGTFLNNKENKLSYDLIIVDEISMINGDIFNKLLDAIREGSKLVMLGDTGQLESIGECNIAADMINSGIIPVCNLTKIHRQAQKSAIITESVKIRNGEQLFEKGWVGTETRGELQDLTLDIYSDKNNTAYKIIEYYKEQLNIVYDYFKIQVIVPMKSRGDASVWNLNQCLQEICNPADHREELTVNYPGRGLCHYRIGDKVINIKNNYKALNTNGEKTSVFNGNIGRVVGLDKVDGYLIINFPSIGTIVMSDEQLENIELAYAITCHKMQGSQSDIVIAGFDYSSFALLSRELVYTAITRASKKCIICAQNDALRYAINQKGVSRKKTHLINILQHIYKI